MCGIGGIYTTAQAQIDLGSPLASMLAVQRHRGPDAEGIWQSEDRSIGLLHNRLSILDLSAAGNQPMPSVCGRFVIVFNGEIYNYVELKAELAQQGGEFRTESDTEVILQAYRLWGESMLTRLRGMFAFALYDRETRHLICARDRVGKKPFVYMETRIGFAFASEIPSLRKSGLHTDNQLDHAALAGMLLHNMRQLPDPCTIFRSISRLRPGHAMIVHDGRIQKQWRYWTPARADGPVTPQRLRDALEESVRLRMRSDVPVAALLSGGVDSSAIVALMTAMMGKGVLTYAFGLDPHDEDLRRARVMAERLGTEHREVYFQPERQWDFFRRLIGAYGEPIMLLPLVHAFELCETIHGDGIRVVLGGHGADEIFYGYTGHVKTALLSNIIDVAPRASAGLFALLGGEGEKLAALLRAPRGKRKAALYRNYEATDWQGVVSADARAELVNRTAEEMGFWGELCPAGEYIDESNFVGLLVENTASVTISSDLPPMLASVEMRAPFLDEKVMSLAFATPVRKKVPWLAPHHRLKWLLRQAVRELVPHELLFAPKRGFGSGIGQDAVLRGPWSDIAERLFAEPDDAQGLFDPKFIRGMWQRFKTHGSAGSNLVSNMFAIQYWLQTESGAFA